MTGRGVQSIFVAMVLIMSTPTLAWAQSNPLDQYRWKNRPLLVFAENANDPNLEQTRKALRASACELTDRDMVIGWILETGPSRLGTTPVDSKTSNAIRSRLRVTQGDFTAVLIGKDGGVKARYAKAPNLQDVFALIDGMPMRRSEMRERGLDCDTN